MNYCAVQKYDSCLIMQKKTIPTVSDVFPGPLVILEERMPLYLIYTITAKSNLPVNVNNKRFES